MNDDINWFPKTALEEMQERLRVVINSAEYQAGQAAEFRAKAEVAERSEERLRELVRQYEVIIDRATKPSPPVVHQTIYNPMARS